MTSSDHNLFSRFAERFPATTATVLLETPTGQRHTYADALSASARFAHYLTDLGLRAGDRVTVQVSKSPESLWLYLACLRAGFVYQPLNEAYRQEEMAYFIGDAEPSLIVCDPANQAMIADLANQRDCPVLTLGTAADGSLIEASRSGAAEFETIPRDPDDVAVLLYSSGTTGKPKGAMLTHGNLIANTDTLVRAWGFTSDDRLLHALPIFHAHGLFVATGCALMSGASMVFLSRFDAETVVAQLPECTVMMGVPTYYSRLLQTPMFEHESCRNMRLFISGSAALQPETFKAFEQRSGHAILERYGMTETLMNTSNPLDGDRRPGSVGPPLPGVSVRVVDANDDASPKGSVGNLQISGPNVFAGYWRMPIKTAQEFTADGWFRTGDLAKIDADGYVSIVGRSKDMIITGGLNVYPFEVEQVIDQIAGVAESAVVGISHADFGEAVVAVVATETDRELAEQAVIRTVREHLADFKAPKRIVFVDRLPRNTMGKVEKARLREDLAGMFR
jgi:malonyl-CoA/methylmalonyl-CoA synthetase